MLSRRLVRPLLPAAILAGILVVGCGRKDGGPTAPVVGSGTVTIQPEPESLQAPWLLAGPGGLRETGVGTTTLDGLPEGSYTLIWRDHPDHVLPEPSVATFNLEADAAYTCSGTYRFAPRSRVEVTVEPAGLPVRWRLTGPDGTDVCCRGDGGACDLFDGSYTLACVAPPGWQAVTPLEQTRKVGSQETWQITVAFEQQQERLGLALALDGQVWRTDDDGATWRPVGHLGHTNAQAIAMPDIGAAFAVAGTRIFRSLDGGETWEISYEHTDSHVSLRDIVFDRWDTGLAVGAGGTIIGTRTCGVRWHDRSLSVGGHFLGAALIGSGDDALAVAVGSKLGGDPDRCQAAATQHAFIPRYAIEEVEPLIFDVPPAEIIPPDAMPYLHDFGRDVFCDADWIYDDVTRTYSLCFVGADGAYVTSRYQRGGDPFPGEFERFERKVGLRYNAVCDGLAVGDGGWIRPAGRLARPTSIASENLFDVASPDGGATFVVVGEAGAVLRGDGQGAWSHQTLGGAALRSVAFVDALPAAAD